MHIRNPYNSPPNFAQLAETYSALRPYLIHTANGVTINFQDHQAQRCLTEALLHRDFDVNLTIPEDRLCPPVPNRLNYILWLQDILTYTKEHIPSLGDAVVTGIDIGTGASAIYPLLGCSVEPRWHFLATDIDERSIQYAKRNVEHNGFQDRITILHVDSDGPIFPILLDEEDAPVNTTPSFEFTMCNPPFYGSHKEVEESAEAKEFGPNAVCTGADNEMITAGGEVTFVRKMVHESLRLRAHCRWYTSMLGKMSSLTEVVDLLRKEKIDNYAVTEFVQGRTRRWAIAWSFTDIHLPDSFARIQNPSLQKLMPLRNTLRQSYPDEASLDDVRQALAQVLAAIEGVTLRTSGSQDVEWDDEADSVVASAIGDTWSRAARRKKLKTGNMPNNMSSTLAPLVCAIRIRGATPDISPFIEFQWVMGRDRGLFESFTSHAGRKVAAALSSS